MSNTLIGNAVYRIERSTILENPRLDAQKSCLKNENCAHLLPHNHWRKTLDCSKNPINCVHTVIYKDNMAINGRKLCAGGACERERRLPNRKFISSYSTLNARKNENAKICREKILKSKFTNPNFQTTGAVSGRNRIAKLKNDAISFPTTYWTKKNIKEEKRCKPYHYGGKRKVSLLICPPKDK